MFPSQSHLLLLSLVELSVIVFRGPDAEGWAGLTEHGVPELLARVQKNPAVSPVPVSGLAHALSQLPGGDYQSLETEYVRLFIAGSGGVPVPLYESCHQGDLPRTMGQSALDMQSRLSEAGLELSLESNEPSDHLTIELEYLFYLLSEGWTGREDFAARGVEFAGAVMLPWVRCFRDDLADADPHPVFRHAAEIAVDTLEAISKS